MKFALQKLRRRKRRGMALLAALIFVVLFSAFSVGMISMSSSNIQTADNMHKANLARSTAESGVEYVKHWLGQISVPCNFDQSQRYAYLLNGIQSTLDGSNISYQVNSQVLTLGSSNYPVTLDAADGRNFWATIEPDGVNGAWVTVTGRAGNLERTIRTNFTYGFEQNQSSVFDFGVATKGPLSLSGNIQLDGVNISVESDVYIESELQNDALSIIGNSQIAGDVKITNPDAYVILQGGKAGIGGETGLDAINNHVEIGVPPTDFPNPNTSHFEQYVNGDTITSANVGSYTTGGTFENIRIAAGTNPHFSGNVTLMGVVFIESPNVVTFSGNADITGIIVGDGDVTDHSGTNQINFTGNVSSASVASLPQDSQFAGIHSETGTFIMAPGFSTSFGGSFDTLNGCIASNGVSFFGNAGGIIGGSVVNYSPTPMDLSGNSDLYFNRSGITDIPAGFEPTIYMVINYDPSSYYEVH